MSRRVEYLQQQILSLMGPRKGGGEIAKRAAIRATAQAVHAELLLSYWMRETLGHDDLDRVEGEALDGVMRYVRSVGDMLQDQSAQDRAGGA